MAFFTFNKQYTIDVLKQGISTENYIYLTGLADTFQCKELGFILYSCYEQDGKWFYGESNLESEDDTCSTKRAKRC